MRSIVVFAVVLACGAAVAAAQVPPGHALCVARGVNPTSSLLLFEPLRGTTTALDTTALGTLRLTAALPDRGRLILAGGPAATTDDVLMQTTVNGNAVLAPSLLALGLRGRALAVFPAPNNTELLVATTLGLFAAPVGGGVARPLSPSIASMGNTSATLLDRARLVTTGTDQSAAPGLWLFDVLGQSLSFVPLRLPAPLAVANGPAPGTLLLGDSTGQLWAYEIATQAQTPFAHVASPSIHALLGNPDQRHWLAATPGALHVVQGAGSVITHPLPAVVWTMSYQPYTSSVNLRGAGCRGTGPLPPELATLGRPTPGNTAFALTLAHAPASTLAVLVLGGDRIDVGLDAFGFTGCRLYTTPLITLAVSTGATGGAQYPLPVPPDAGLAGGRLEAQWIVHDPGANRASFTTTNAASLTF